MRPRVAAVGAVLGVAALLVPLLWIAAASLAPEEALFAGGLPRPSGLDHYRAVFADRAFWQPLRTSAVVAGLTAILTVALAAPCAYALARLRFPFRGPVLAATLLAGMFPQIAVVSPLYLALRAARLVDTYPGLVLPYVTLTLPAAVWLLAASLRQLPAELEEAAQVDGARWPRILLRVVLPPALPGLAATGILAFVTAWNELLFALTFTVSPERQTVPVALALFQGRYQVPWGQVLAAAVVASGPPLLFILVLERWIVRGLTAGAVR